jgi:Cu-processing system permease protein
MSLPTVRRVALAAFRESVRDRVLYSLVGFALLVIGASVLVGQLTAGQDVKIIKDLGLAAMSLFGVFIAIFIGIGLVAKEVERRSVYSLLSKPVRRSELVIGKYAGLLVTLAVNLAAMAAVLYLVLAWLALTTPAQLQAGWDAPPLDPRLMLAVYLILLKLGVVVAIAILFSTFSSPVLSAALSLALFVAGHFSADLRNFDAVVDSPAITAIARALYYLLPNFATFDAKAEIVHGLPVAPLHVVTATAYALLYVATLLLASVTIFSRRDLK